jgi:hypothetical protein
MSAFDFFLGNGSADAAPSGGSPPHDAIAPANAAVRGRARSDSGVVSVVRFEALQWVLQHVAAGLCWLVDFGLLCILCAVPFCSACMQQTVSGITAPHPRLALVPPAQISSGKRTERSMSEVRNIDRMAKVIYRCSC